MLVWITRDNKMNSSICLWNGNEDLAMNGGEWLSDKDIALEFVWAMGQSPQQFKKFFGFTPRKGTCKQMELTLKEVE